MPVRQVPDDPVRLPSASTRQTAVQRGAPSLMLLWYSSTHINWEYWQTVSCDYVTCEREVLWCFRRRPWAKILPKEVSFLPLCLLNSAKVYEVCKKCLQFILKLQERLILFSAARKHEICSKISKVFANSSLPFSGWSKQIPRDERDCECQKAEKCRSYWAASCLP